MVTKLTIFDALDAASKLLADPLTLSVLLFKASRNVLAAVLEVRNAIDRLLEISKRLAEEKQCLMVKLSPLEAAYSLRLLLFSKVLIAISLERETETYTGGVALEELEKLYRNNCMARLWANAISLDSLPQDLRSYVLRAIEEHLKGPPDAWIGKELRGYKVLRILSMAGSYNYVLLARDAIGRSVVIKIPREDIVVGKGYVGLLEVFRGYVNMLDILSMDRDFVRKRLLVLGIEPELADTLLLYKRYIAHLYALHIPSQQYSSVDEYVENPPTAIEEFGDLGDLETKARAQPLQYEELLFVAVRVLGALALTHIAGYLHMDVKPRNIVLTSCSDEPYGYCPKLNDFVSIPRVAGGSIIVKDITPGYADPLAIARGEAGFDYDVYSVGATLYFLYTGRVPLSRLILNAVLLNKLYGFSIDISSLSKEVEGFEEALRELESILAMPLRSLELIEKALEVLRDVEMKTMETISTLPNAVKSFIEKSMSLDPEARYRSALDAWLDVVKICREQGLETLLPRAEGSSSEG